MSDDGDIQERIDELQAKVDALAEETQAEPEPKSPERALEPDPARSFLDALTAAQGECTRSTVGR